MYLFRPPTVSEGPIGDHRLFDFYEMPRGITILVFDGECYETRWPQNEDLELADNYYLGGSVHKISDEEAQVLMNAGYEDGLEEIS
jgi:hypothetical protein